MLAAVIAPPSTYMGANELRSASERGGDRASSRARTFATAGPAEIGRAVTAGEMGGPFALGPARPGQAGKGPGIKIAPAQRPAPGHLLGHQSRWQQPATIPVTLLQATAIGFADRRHRQARPQRDGRHHLDAAAYDQVLRPGNDGLGRPVDGLSRRRRLPVDGGTGDALGPACGQDRPAGDVASLGAYLGRAPQHHVVHQRGVKPVPGPRAGTGAQRRGRRGASLTALRLAGRRVSVARPPRRRGHARGAVPPPRFRDMTRSWPSPAPGRPRPQARSAV